MSLDGIEVYLFVCFMILCNPVIKNDIMSLLYGCSHFHTLNFLLTLAMTLHSKADLKCTILMPLLGSGVSIYCVKRSSVTYSEFKILKE
jgi:hypothetical protein